MRQSANAGLMGPDTGCPFQRPMCRCPPMRVSASIARAGAYKRNRPRHDRAGMPFRLEASVTSSVLRIPLLIGNTWFAMLTSPVTMFVRPWEFVDLTQAGIRYARRFRTGQPILDRLRTTLRWFKVRDFEFRLVREAPGLTVNPVSVPAGSACPNPAQPARAPARKPQGALRRRLANRSGRATGGGRTSDAKVPDRAPGRERPGSCPNRCCTGTRPHRPE